MNNNMMSSTNADVNTNANLVNAEVIKVITFVLCLRVGRIGPFRISWEFLRI